ALARRRLRAALAFGAVLLASCGAPAGVGRSDAAWWSAIAQPPPAEQAWPLAALAPARDAAAAPGQRWAMEGGPGAPSPTLCRSAGDEDQRAITGVDAADFEARLRARTAPGGNESYGLTFRQQGAEDYYL